MIGREGLHSSSLVDIFERHGATDPVSYLSTGNVAFGVGADELGRLVDGVESAIAAVIDRRERVFARRLDELAQLAATDPYDHPAMDIKDRLVTFTQHPVVIDLELPFVADKGDYAVLDASDREVYSVTLDIVGRIRSPGGVIEKLVGEKVTTRSWNTVRRVVEKESLRP